MRVHDQLAKRLVEHGVSTMFGVVGDANLHVIESFTRSERREYVAVASEASAVLAAIGYAQASGAVGVATVTHGPGLTNTVTALVEASRGRVPVILIAGDTPSNQEHHIQSVNQECVSFASEALFVDVGSAGTLIEDVDSAFEQAITGRCPVVLNIAIDLMSKEVPAGDATPLPSPPPGANLDDEALENAVGVIAASSRPIVISGRGAAGYRADLIKFAARIGALLATTLRGKDRFVGEDSDLGIFGSLTDEVALEVIGQSDCIIAFGCSLNLWTTAEGALVDGKRIVHVDRDPTTIGKYTPVTVGLVGEPNTAIDAMTALLDEAEIQPARFASDHASTLGKRRQELSHTDRSTETSIDLRTALDRINASFPENRMVVTDNGRFIHHAFTHLLVRDPLDYVHAVNFGSIGLGVAVAIGASYARADQPVLLACGDGGFAISGLSELAMAAMHRCNITVLLLNDGAYGAEYVQLQRAGLDPTNTTFNWPDFGPVADALGASGYTARNLAELDAVLESADFTSGPNLIDIRIDPDRV